MTTLLLALSACSSLGSSGPTAQAINKADGSFVDRAGIQVIDITDAVARRAVEVARPALFSEVFGDVRATETVIQRGDVIDVTIFEAPPAVGSPGTELEFAL